MKLLRFLLLLPCFLTYGAKNKTNFVLVMADDQGWGQTGYYKHPVLKTPNLDDMASQGLRFDRFYAAAPVCSPTTTCAAVAVSPCTPYGFANR